MSITIYFKYYKGVFPIDLARKYSSPYFQQKEIIKGLSNNLLNNIQEEYSSVFLMDEEQFKCGNEIFPEAAISDPLSDLNTYDEWQNGRRIFPHRGEYAPFGIEAQLAKIESSVSFGVVGEILTGLFCQSYFAPYVLVRNIRRWPDFIFHKNNNKFVFVESKATATELDEKNPLDGNFELNTFNEFLIQSMKSILSSETTNVCLSHTRILGDKSQRVFHLNVLEFKSNSVKDPSQESIPEPVVSGLAYQIADQYIGYILAQEPIFHGTDTDDELKKYIKKYQKASTNKIKEMLIQKNDLKVNDGDNTRIEDKVESILKKIGSKKNKLEYKKNIGKNIKDSISSGNFTNVSSICDKNIFFRQLTNDEESIIARQWYPDWSNAIKPIDESNPLKWRCSNSILYITDQSI